MRIAWFRPAQPDASNLLDDLGAVILALCEAHAIEAIDRQRAHDFVWMQSRGAYDALVYELDNTSNHEFIWPYLAHFPGIVALRSTTLHDSRAASLVRRHRERDYVAEMAFGGVTRRATTLWHAPRGTWPLLRVPLLGSRLAVVNDPALVESLQRDYPGARIRCAPVGVPEPAGSIDAPADTVWLPPSGGSAFDEARPTRFGILETSRVAAVHRAAYRAEAMAARLALVASTDASTVLREADVILALHWPSFGEPLTAALLGMAAAKPVVVSETFATARWPALDPQTWQPRDHESAERPIVVSIDPRDEEHSLMLAMRRLSSDQALRRELGTAAHEWWRQHGTLAHATRAWEGILLEASTLQPPARPAEWPGHLSADGSEHARGVLRDFGVDVDFL